MASTATPQTSPTHLLADYAAALRYDDLPGEVVETIKRMTLDSLGCALAATTLGDGCAETMAVMRDLGGNADSTIVGLGAKVAAPNAAFANGALVHALNYDPNRRRGRPSRRRLPGGAAGDGGGGRRRIGPRIHCRVRGGVGNHGTRDGLDRANGNPAQR